MARKPPRARNAGDLQQQLDTWLEVFETGHDWWGKLAAIGVKIEATERWRDPVYPAVEYSNWEEVRDALAKEAWERLGAAYMRQRGDPPYNRAVPWALTTFGAPPGWKP
jgi:hypothetical protein